MPTLTYLSQQKSWNIPAWGGYVLIGIIAIAIVAVGVVIHKTRKW